MFLSKILYKDLVDCTFLHQVRNIAKAQKNLRLGILFDHQKLKILLYIRLRYMFPSALQLGSKSVHKARKMNNFRIFRKRVLRGANFLLLNILQLF